jgi:hypothetical protein
MLILLGYLIYREGKEANYDEVIDSPEFSAFAIWSTVFLVLLWPFAVLLAVERYLPLSEDARVVSAVLVTGALLALVFLTNPGYYFVVGVVLFVLALATILAVLVAE